MATRSSSGEAAADPPARSAGAPGGQAGELAAAAVVLGYGVLITRVVPHELYVPVNLAAAGLAVVAVHRWGRTGWRDLGLARDRVLAGLKLGGLTVIPIAAAVGIGLALPFTRDFFRDTTIVNASGAEALYTLLLRIPFGTALAEELIFRGALLGLFLQRHRPWVAVLMSSLVFGLWHVLPTLNSLGTNPGAAGASGNALLEAGAVTLVVLATAVAGSFFCWLRLRSGSIVAPWLTHTAFNSIGYIGSRLEGLISR